VGMLPGARGTGPTGLQVYDGDEWRTSSQKAVNMCHLPVPCQTDSPHPCLLAEDTGLTGLTCPRRAKVRNCWVVNHWPLVDWKQCMCAQNPKDWKKPYLAPLPGGVP
jgi:hypothetical protein